MPGVKGEKFAPYCERPGRTSALALHPGVSHVSLCERWREPLLPNRRLGRTRPGTPRRSASQASVSPGEDGGLTRLAGDEVFAFLSVEGEEPYGSLCLLLYPLLGLLGAVPGCDDEAALMLENLPELVVGLGVAGVGVPGLGWLSQHVVLDLPAQPPPPPGPAPPRRRP